MDIEEDIKELKEVLLHYRETEKVRKAIKNILAEREEDKKRIEELEDENKVQRHQIEILLNKKNY